MNNYTPPSANQSNATLKSRYTAPISPYNVLIKTTIDAVVLKSNYTAPQSHYDVVLKSSTSSIGVFFTGNAFSKIGSPSIVNTALAIKLGAFDSLETGNAQVSNKAKLLSFGGINEFTANNPSIFNTAQAINFGGFDSFLAEYTLHEFNVRMRVIKTDPTLQNIAMFGYDYFSSGFLTIKNQQHYIRPDGNSDMYRQGIQTWISN